jgi:hypothetical protein
MDLQSILQVGSSTNSREIFKTNGAPGFEQAPQLEALDVEEVLTAWELFESII